MKKEVFTHLNHKNPRLNCIRYYIFKENISLKTFIHIEDTVFWYYKQQPYKIFFKLLLGLN